MPNNCSALIQRKQNILHKILRSNSDGKLQNAVAETTAELCVAGTRKTPVYSSSSAHHLTGVVTTSASNGRRSNLFTSNRIQPSSHHLYDAHLPSIRDTNGYVDRHEKFPTHSRPKTPVANASPKSTGRPPSTSISSIFNALAKRSSENFASTNGDYEETTNYNPVPPSRRTQRPHKANGINQHTTKLSSQKPSGDSGIDVQYPTSSADVHHHQQQQQQRVSTRLRPDASQAHVEFPLVQETVAKERTSIGPLYQRRQNNSMKTYTKQKIDKYRRRSEEVTQALNGSTQTNNGSIPTASPLPTPRPKPPPSSPTAAVHRVSSDGENQARVEVLRLSMNTNLIHTDQQVKTQSHQHARNRVKSPYLYTNHHQTKPTTPTSNSQTPSVRLRRNHEPIQPPSSVNSSHHPHTNNHRPQVQNTVKQPVDPSPGNLYLAFIASRHLSTLEDALLECDIDHQKLLRIFTWLKGVEDHRYEQSNHEQLLIEQNQRMLDEDENFSLYSEIQHAVDDIPANTTGKSCEKIVTMQFED